MGDVEQPAEQPADEPFGAMIGDAVRVRVDGRVIEYVGTDRVRVALFGERGPALSVVVDRDALERYP